jgi:tRNA(Leu) C34 or U34 (ribose-2'-O)-methylase TrmL
MLLPITLKYENNTIIGEYSFSNKNIILKNILVTPDIPIETGERYCIHFAAVISRVSNEQFDMISKHLEEVQFFKKYREDIENIDYKNYQRFGNYYNIVKKRFRKLESR